jgi:hypothetical protein
MLIRGLPGGEVGVDQAYLKQLVGELKELLEIVLVGPKTISPSSIWTSFRRRRSPQAK